MTLLFTNNKKIDNNVSHAIVENDTQKIKVTSCRLLALLETPPKCKTAFKR